MNNMYPYYGDQTQQNSMIPQYQQYQQPANVLPYYQQQVSRQMPQNPVVDQPIWYVDWIRGDIAAEAYNAQRGKVALLMDADRSVFFIKAVDQYGFPQKMRKFKFIEVTDEEQQQANAMQSQQQPQVDMSQYVRKDDVERMIKERLEEIIK